ncbi:MAG: hypothetical protein DHS20C11_37780 [Lysobacteraceae bacterium]|nr:MAG: hypothetical protein DHS20C11_37780 [Xanthomonadaceae bacterium]
MAPDIELRTLTKPMVEHDVRAQKTDPVAPGFRTIYRSSLGRALILRGVVATALGTIALWLVTQLNWWPGPTSVGVWAAGSIVLIYLVSWIMYRIARRAIAPLVELAHVVESLDAQEPDVAQLDPKRLARHQPVAEIRALADALHSYAGRIRDFIDREQNFTRDASHELRSPLTVIKVAVDVLLDADDQDDFTRHSLNRIRDAARDMEALMEALLLLARDSDTGLYHAVVNVNAVVREEIERSELLLKGKPVVLQLEEQEQFVIEASIKVVAVMIGNLIRNACQYTPKGVVQVTVGEGMVTIKDSGIGMTEDEAKAAFKPYFRGGKAQQPGGHGVGLSIVNRLSDRFNWPVSLQSELGVGTEIVVRFPEHQVFK